MQDILKPVDAMLYRRGRNNIEVILDCPYPNLCVETDSLRLKQIVLNLGRNACKLASNDRDEGATFEERFETHTFYRLYCTVLL